MGEDEVIRTVSGAPAPEPASPESIAALFPQLEIQEIVGRGGMGVVYKARHRGLHRLVALKILSVDPDREPAVAERFVREAHALAALDHPSIVRVHDCGRTGELLYLVMEFVEGANLRQVIRGGELAPREALAIVSELCSALGYAHSQGVVHRDIKPENVIVTTLGRVKVADFGLAKILDPSAGPERLTKAAQAMGTPHYMAPEQIEHPLTVDHRADIYSLGVVLYELLTGELPLGRFAPPSKKVEIDVRLDEVVLKTLEKEPARRYQQIVEVKTDLDAISSSRSSRAAGEVKLEGIGLVAGYRRHGHGRVYRLGFWGCLSVLAVFCILAVLFFLGRTRAQQAELAMYADQARRAQADVFGRGGAFALSLMSWDPAAEPLAPIEQALDQADPPVSAEVRELVLRAIERRHLEYLLAESEATTIHEGSWDSTVSRRVEVAAFPEERQAIRAGLRDELEDFLQGHTVPELATPLAALFPFGDEPVTFEIQRAGQSYVLRLIPLDGVSPPTERRLGPDLPPGVQRFWDPQLGWPLR
jgi:serine/threonine protein kinase